MVKACKADIAAIYIRNLDLRFDNRNLTATGLRSYTPLLFVARRDLRLWM